MRISSNHAKLNIYDICILVQLSFECYFNFDKVNRIDFMVTQVECRKIFCKKDLLWKRSLRCTE